MVVRTVEKVVDDISGVNIIVVVHTIGQVVVDVSGVNAEEEVWADDKSNVGVAIIIGSLLVDVGIKTVVPLKVEGKLDIKFCKFDSDDLDS